MLYAIALTAALATGRTAHDREPTHENIYVRDPDEPKHETQSVPEPIGLTILLTGALAAGLAARRKR